MSTEEEIADLKRQLAEVKDAMRAAQPKPKPTAEEEERAVREHMSRVHAMRERQANAWMPPSAVHEMANHPCNQVMGGVVRDRHAPNTAAMIPSSSQQSTAAPAKSV